MRALNPESFHVSVNETPETDSSPETPYNWIMLSIIMTLIVLYVFKLIK